MTVDRLSCPPRDVLIEAAAPSATPAQRERIVDHLITCAACAEDVRLLQALGPWAAEHAGSVAPGAAAGAAAAPVPRRVRWLPPGYAAAAVLAIVAVGLTVQNRRLDRANRELQARSAAADASRSADAAARQRVIAELERRIATADAPDVNPPIIDLEAADAPRTASPRPAAPASGSARHVVFILNTARRQAGATYDVDIVDAANRVAWTGAGLAQSVDGTLTLVVPRALAVAGWRIRLYARAGERRTLVEQYVVPASR